MNKIISATFSILVIVLVIVSTNVNFNINRNGSLIELSLANIEALANGENSDGYSKVTICDMAGGGVAVYCEGSGKLECKK